MDDLERCLKGDARPSEEPRRVDVILERLLWVTAVAMLGVAAVLSPATALNAGQDVQAAPYSMAPTSGLATRVDAIGAKVDEVAGKQIRSDTIQEQLLERLKSIEELNLDKRLTLFEERSAEQAKTWAEIRGLFWTVLGGVLVLIVTQVLSIKESVKHRRTYQSDARRGADQV